MLKSTERQAECLWTTLYKYCQDNSKGSCKADIGQIKINALVPLESLSKRSALVLICIGKSCKSIIILIFLLCFHCKFLLPMSKKENSEKQPGKILM